MGRFSIVIALFIFILIASPAFALTNCVQRLLAVHRQLRDLSWHDLAFKARTVLTARDRYIFGIFGFEPAYRFEPTGSNGESGDYYHVHLRKDGRLLLLLGDVEGAGEEAESVAQTMRKLLVGPVLNSAMEAETARDVLIGINESFTLDEWEPGSAMAVVLLDRRSGRGEFAGVMHAAPLYIKRAGTVLQINPGGGLPICRGDIEFSQYLGEATPFELQTGDTLILSSDGLLDGIAPGKSKAGAYFHLVRERLPEILGALPNDISPDDLLNEVFRYREGQEDDEMVIALRLPLR